jgi:hypothetical protein
MWRHSMNDDPNKRTKEASPSTITTHAESLKSQEAQRQLDDRLVGSGTLRTTSQLEWRGR